MSDFPNILSVPLERFLLGADQHLLTRKLFRLLPSLQAFWKCHLALSPDLRGEAEGVDGASCLQSQCCFPLCGYGARNLDNAEAVLLCCAS